MVWQKAHQLVLEVYRSIQQFSQSRNLGINFSIETSVCISMKKESGDRSQESNGRRESADLEYGDTSELLLPDRRSK
ncbi:hypothetical protein [Hydrocoleum sp. CS-953]|uniref:hypothetical protein n=1 Tax=Hydrocoleum sp. CS-953 TaxID=1671698 RepID=UPI00352B1F55